jgi:hypothetical protein
MVLQIICDIAGTESTFVWFATGHDIKSQIDLTPFSSVINPKWTLIQEAV